MATIKTLLAPPLHPCTRLSALVLFLLAPAISRGQTLGQLTCAHANGSVSLYSSMLTLDVRETLPCGEQVEIVGRYDNYFGVRTAKGETGYVTLDSLLLLKTAPGAKPALPLENNPAKDQPSNTPAPAKFLILLDSTPVHMKIAKTISSADAQVGDDVIFEVSEDVVIDGFLVIPKGAIATGVVNEVEPKKALGRGGKLGVLARSVRRADNGEVVLRSGGEAKGSHSTAGMVIPVMHGKDITFPKGMEFTAFVNGDNRLKRENFHPAPDVPDAPPTGTVTNLQHP